MHIVAVAVRVVAVAVRVVAVASRSGRHDAEVRVDALGADARCLAASGTPVQTT